MLLLDYINGFNKIDIVGMIEFGKSSNNTHPKNPSYEIVDMSKLESLDYDQILISSYEYMYEIQDMLNELKNKKPVYSIYDNASRSFEDTLTKFPKFKHDLV
jgi:hypothetical protein